MRGECSCKWRGVKLPDGRTATGFFPCDSCAPSEVDKLRCLNDKEIRDYELV